MPAPYFFYRIHDPIKTIDAMERLVLAFNPDTSTDTNPALDNVLGYAALILAGVRNLQPGTLADVYATQVLSYIDTERVERLAQKTGDANMEDLNELGVELLYCAVSLGVVEDVVPYTPDELNEIINSNANGFHEAIVALTIGYFITSGDAAYGPIILRLLAGNKDENLRTPYEWVDAFMLGLLIHAAWSYFPQASDRDRQYIIQHYFYYAVVSGVPVRSWLNIAVSEHPELSVNTLMQRLSISQEVIPEDINLTRSVDFANVVRQYVTAVNQNAIPTLAAEKFLGKWYGSDAVSNLYRNWLRDALSTAYRLQTGNL